jgi:hypothetical protein
MKVATRAVEIERFIYNLQLEYSEVTAGIREQYWSEPPNYVPISEEWPLLGC